MKNKNNDTQKLCAVCHEITGNDRWMYCEKCLDPSYHHAEKERKLIALCKKNMTDLYEAEMMRLEIIAAQESYAVSKEGIGEKAFQSLKLLKNTGTCHG